MAVSNMTSTGKGINADLIPNAQEAIATYKTNMGSRLDEFKSEINFSTAFIGGQQSMALSNYYSRLMDSVKETFAYLDSFSTAIGDALAAYQAEEQAIADSLNGSGVSERTDPNAPQAFNGN